jgi:predicted O-methyltransferase YrrM
MLGPKMVESITPSSHEIRKTLDSLPWGQQQIDEITWLLIMSGQLQSVLEIGSCEGRTLRMLSEIAAPGAVLRSIDKEEHPEWTMNSTIMRAQGFDIQRYTGDSTDPQTLKWSREWAPYDMIFIDGDHTYEGVKRDFENYAWLGARIVLHDINHPDEGEDGSEFGVRRFWREMKDNLGYISFDCALTGYYMGLGLLVPTKIQYVERGSGNGKYA